MNKIFLSATLGFATLIAVSVSLACSYWFFYSLFDGHGYEAIAAGLAGCAIQIFSYGFSQYLTRAKWYTFPLWAMLCIMPLLLSIFSTYTTIYSYLAVKQENNLRIERRDAAIVDLLEQSKRDKAVVAEAAQQSLNERYRTQANKLIQGNQEALKNDLALIDKLGESEGAATKASPLDGLVRITGDSKYTTLLFCAWLAILFDLLPVFALSILCAKKSDAGEGAAQHIQSPTIDAVKAAPVILEAPLIDPVKSAHVETVTFDSVLAAPIEDVVDCRQPEPEPTKLPHKTLIQALLTGHVLPNYADIQKYSGYSRWQAQDFFKKAVDEGHLKKEGRAFIVVSNVTPLQKLHVTPDSMSTEINGSAGAFAGRA